MQNLFEFRLLADLIYAMMFARSRVPPVEKSLLFYDDIFLKYRVEKRFILLFIS